ncbi:metallophosphoesterase family protein [Granulicella mallensis]|uniref:Metallophosphoesterase n=1 Tax=Granulicella mallensis (strain ATCC BAA-1857 / DSM 23137 / MP5ACTX8) TaxID=682795 RepID=G8NT26_GRAMM|nr:metallophosphoesterase [Granulicella mallensis]AEU37456.1 metallophosphoesterase [Granulicella mallensis MP5ACTX8]
MLHDKVGDKSFITAGLDAVIDHLKEPTGDNQTSIASAISSTDKDVVEAERLALLHHFTAMKSSASTEQSHRDVHYVSRVDPVGAFQAVLAKLFKEIPGLQGYGDANPIWATTLVEQGIYDLKSFFHHVHDDVSRKEPFIASVLKEWKQLKFERAPYPAGLPATLPLSDHAKVALLADWGGDNPAARKVAAVVNRQKPDLAIHLGDIYYGGIASECETFLRLWPLQAIAGKPGAGIPPKSSLALNGNHEMYSGGEAYFSVVLKAFGQPQPFFCLENKHWRLIGLDTAYAAGRLKPTSETDPIAPQWNWLLNLLKTGEKKANIFLTHHQPVSAHTDEHNDSAPLRSDIVDLMAVDGIGQTAIFGWFFGHEHRCALYRDSELPYNARLIGNGCIPHQVQEEKAADAGCNNVDYFNKRQDAIGSGAAVSMYAQLTFQGSESAELLIEYIDEDNEVWGSEVWNAERGRLDASGKFQETDFDKQLSDQ